MMLSTESDACLALHPKSLSVKLMRWPAGTSMTHGHELLPHPVVWVTDDARKADGDVSFTYLAVWHTWGRAVATVGRRHGKRLHTYTGPTMTLVPCDVIRTVNYSVHAQCHVTGASEPIDGTWNSRHGLWQSAFKGDSAAIHLK